MLLWNHSYSWGPMFVDCQNFAASWGRNFDWFVALQYRSIHFFVKRRWGRKFVGGGNPQNQRTLTPHEQ